LREADEHCGRAGGRIGSDAIEEQGLTMSNFILSEQTHETIRSRRWDVAVLPFGATEPHNLHMPYGTDTLQVEVLGRRACELAGGKGASVLLLPTIPFGVNTNHLKVPGAVAISLTPTTLLAILRDVAESLERQGVRKLVLLNGHGGNELKPLVRELHHRSGVFICLCDWFAMGSDLTRQIMSEKGEHADETETSLGLAFFPELLAMDRAGDGKARASRFEAINKGWISIVRPWHLLTKDTGVGNPHAATAEKGRRLMDGLVQRLGEFLYDLAKSPLDDSFPFA
jgi:creatinine amidohydrolase